MPAMFPQQTITSSGASKIPRYIDHKPSPLVSRLQAIDSQVAECAWAETGEAQISQSDTPSAREESQIGAAWISGRGDNTDFFSRFKIGELIMANEFHIDCKKSRSELWQARRSYNPASLWRLTIRKWDFKKKDFVVLENVDTQTNQVYQKFLSEAAALAKSNNASAIAVRVKAVSADRRRQSPLPGSRIPKRESITVLQRQYAVVTADSSSYILGTYGAATCSILGLWDAHTRMAFLVHWDGTTHEDEILDVLNTHEFGKRTSHVYLIGGDAIMFLRLYDALSNASYQNFAFVAQTEDGSSFALDAITGMTYANVDPKDLTRQDNQDWYLKTFMCFRHLTNCARLLEGNDLGYHLSLSQQR